MRRYPENSSNLINLKFSCFQKLCLLRPFYTAIPDVEPDAQEGDNEGVKPLSKMNKDELLAADQAAGV